VITLTNSVQQIFAEYAKRLSVMLKEKEGKSKKENKAAISHEFKA